MGQPKTRVPGAEHAVRFGRLDALRGLAMVWMALYHFAFDLNHFGWLQPKHNFYTDALWTVQRSAIVTLFLFCAGLSLAAALDAGQTWTRFWRRWAQIAEADKVLRVILLADGETVHNAFVDRSFKERER